MTTPAPKPLRIFCSYSHKDEEYLNELRTWLRRLERQRLVEWWHDREISPGWEWEETIDKNLRSADIILLLVTPDFMGSDYVFEKEIDRAIERHERGEARVIPIIVRPADWEGPPLDRLQALPKDARPITTWLNRDEAWLDVARGIRKAVEELLVEHQQRAAAKEQYRKAIEGAWADSQVSASDAAQLAVVASELGLSAETAADTERDVMGDTKEALLEHQEQISREKERQDRERQDRLDDLYARARRSHQNQEWQTVVDIFAQIHAEDPTYPDSEELLVSAREALEAQESERRVAAIYAEGQQHMDAAEWQQALERFEKVHRLQPGYRDTEGLLSQVRQELAPPSTVEVPDLSGQAVSQASSTLVSRGLKLGARSEATSDTISKGQIITQDPETGTEVEAGSSVDVRVSSGSSVVEVPNLAGKNRSEARNTLRAASLALGMIAEAQSDDMSEGKIIQQDPAAGSKVERNSSVRITVSSGTQEKTSTAPPGRSRTETVQAPTSSTERSATRDQDERKLPLKVPRWAILTSVAGLAAVLVVGALITANSFQPQNVPSPSKVADEGTLGFTLARTLSGHTDGVTCIAFSTDGKLLASGSYDDTVRLWDPQSGKRLRTLSARRDEASEASEDLGHVEGVAFSPDGKLLASGDEVPIEHDIVTLWDAQSGKKLRTLNTGSEVAFSPDGKLLASGGEDGSLTLWDPQSGKKLRTLNTGSEVAFSPDGKLLASGRGDGSLTLWEPQSGKKLRTLSGGQWGTFLNDVAFSPDGKLLASAADNGYITLWDPQSGKELRTLSVYPKEEPDDLAFSPDGKLLANVDATVMLSADPQSGNKLRILSKVGSQVYSLALSPDGKLMATGHADGTVTLWKVGEAGR